jgi:Uma2 family endonuclease
MSIATERDTQRFVFGDADWSFYDEVLRRVEGRRVFVTYYKGRLEVVTTSFLHEQLSGLTCRLICILAEETQTPLKTVGRTTLREQVLQEGVEADESFYIGPNVARMSRKRDIDLTVDPPPDLAIEIEVTRRLRQRQLIYRDLGVPELWRSESELKVLVRQGDDYVAADRSPTFPQLAPSEMMALLLQGMGDETVWAQNVRATIRAAIPGTGGVQ